MNNLSLRVKFGLGFGSLLLLLAAMGLAAYESVGQLTEISGRVVKMMAKKDMSSQLEASIEKQTTGVRGFLLAGKEDLLKHDEEGEQKYSENMERLRQAIYTDEGKRLQADIQRSYGEFRGIADQEVELRRAGKSKEAEELAFNSHTAEVRTNLRNAVHELVQLEDKLKDELLKEQVTAESQARWVVTLLALAGLTIGLLMAFWIARSITAAIGRMVALMQEIAANNLMADDTEITSQDELGAAGMALNRMKNNLHQLIRSIRSTAEQVAASSEELSAIGQQITANSEETTSQARVVSEAGGQVNTNLQTLASGAEEMNSTIGEIAKNATEAARVSGEAVAAAESANQTVSKLGDSSVEIAKVIEVITSIAQQTNLLALNEIANPF